MNYESVSFARGCASAPGAERAGSLHQAVGRGSPRRAGCGRSGRQGPRVRQFGPGKNPIPKMLTDTTHFAMEYLKTAFPERGMHATVHAVPILGRRR